MLKTNKSVLYANSALQLIQKCARLQKQEYSKIEPVMTEEEWYSVRI